MENSTYRAIGCTKYGGPEVLEVLDIPIPKLSPNDVLVEVKAVSINPIDYKARNGRKPGPISKESPRVPGYDAAGVISAIGSDVKNFKVGDEVYYAGDVKNYGAYGKYNHIDHRAISLKPKKLSWAEAAAMPLTGLTAWECLLERMKIPEDKEANKGKSILIVAGAGGVGSIAIQIAKKVFGLTVIASASRQETVEFVNKCGADHVINHRNSLKDEFAKINIQEVDYVFHCYEFDNYYAKEIPAILKPFGTLGLISVCEDINLSAFFPKNITIVHEMRNARLVMGVNIEIHGKLLEKMAERLDNGELFSTITEQQTFTLKNLQEGHAKLEKGVVIGKIVFDKVDEFNE